MKSHYLSTDAQPRIWKLFAYSIFPVVMAVGVGMWLSGRIHADPDNQAQLSRTEEVVAQDRLLVDALWSAIEAIKSRAVSLEQVRDAEKHSDARRPTSQPDGLILHWAEFEVKDGKLAGVRQTARNPLFQPSSGIETFESFYLKSALARLNLHELEENGVTVLRVKQDAGRSQEWLAFAFAGQVHAEAIALAGSGATPPVLVALVDPSEVFPIFRRWTSRSEGGNLRGYLVGSDGFVIAHSQHPYVASDFSTTQVFGQGVRDLLAGRVRSGAGVFKAIDQIAVTAAYARPGTLPLAAVVERVNPKAETNPVLASVWALVSAGPADPAIAFGCAAALAMFLAFSMNRLIRKAAGAESTADTVGMEEAVETAMELEAVDSQALTYNEYDERREYSDYAENGQTNDSGYETAPAQAWPASQVPFAGAEQVESEFSNELLSDDGGTQASRRSRSERVLLAQFETEAQNSRDPASVARNLALTTAKLVGAPALFFSYRESLRACLLQAHAGLPVGTSTEALSFRLADPMLVRIARYQKEGRTASLSDDPALMLLLSKRLGGSRCEAWPVIGSGGKLLGVLVVLGANSAAPTQTDSLGQVMKMSARLYERLYERPDERLREV